MTTVIVPKNKCPLNVLADLGSSTRNTWIFLHESVVREIESRVNPEEGDTIRKFVDDVTWCFWPASDEYPSTSIIWKEDKETKWASVIEIRASDICFTDRATDPEDTLFLKMAD